MFKPLSCFIGLRYTKAKRKNHFISFISLVSLLGIALGVMVLITVLSVFNGFEKEVKTRMLNMVPQVTVNEWGGILKNWQPLEKQVKKRPGVVGVAPFIHGQAMLSHAGDPAFCFFYGASPDSYPSVSPLPNKMISGQFSELTPKSFNIILGQGLAARLGVGVGDKITVVVPEVSFTPVGAVPRLKTFTVSGIFNAGYQFDNNYAVMNIEDAATLLKMQGYVSALQLKIANVLDAPIFSHQLNENLKAPYYSTDWSLQNASFFRAIQMQKTLMYFILLLIIAVAAFNMLSTLVMTVTDKRSDIAILRTIGASGRTIMRIFIVQGMTVGIIGTMMGVVFGIILALNVTDIVNKIQDIFNVQFMSKSVYLIDFLPSELHFSDVGYICLASIGLSLVATIYPAWRASKIRPAEALRYE